LEEVTLRSGPKVLTGGDDKIAPIIGYPYWILAQQLRSQPIHLLKIFISISIK
jgi:hypothetical protein